ncbi:MAG: alpha/beta hydrolase [Limnobacter sp.]|nr:alpha/beta hydrolase [Limnobacter sp.]
MPTTLNEFKQQKFDVNGITMNVVIEGKGPDVLLLHGFPDSHSIWRFQIPALVAAGYRVIAPDLRGFGDTDMSLMVGDYHIDNLVKDVIGLLDAVKAKKVLMAGHDWGSVLGWFVALRHPDRVKAYVAMSVGHPTCYATGGMQQKIKGWYTVFFQLRGLAERVLTMNNFAYFDKFTKCPIEMPDWRKSLSRPGRLTAGLNWYRANMAMILPRNHGSVQMPVMGMYSTGDVALIEEQMSRSGDYCSAGWRYERLEGVGHWMTSEAPDKVNSLLVNYFDEHKSKK